MVLLNRSAVRSCLMLAVQADGQEVTTSEALADGDPLHPIQQGFWEKYALQCAYCTAGIIMSVYKLLNRTANTSQEEIYETLGGHTCRSTGYPQLVQSVRRTVEGPREA